MSTVSNHNYTTHVTNRYVNMLRKSSVYETSSSLQDINSTIDSDETFEKDCFIRFFKQIALLIIQSNSEKSTIPIFLLLSIKARNVNFAKENSLTLCIPEKPV